MRFRYPLSWLVLAFALALTAVSAYWMQAVERSDSNTRFEQLINARVNALDSSFEHFELYLRGIGGLFAASSRITPREWSGYIDSLELRRRRDPFISFGYAPLLAARDLPAFLNELRRSQPDFRVWPEDSGQARAAPVTLIQAVRANAVLGAGDDLLARPAFAVTIAAAERSGKPSLSGRIDIGTAAGGTAAGAMLFLPIKRAGAVVGVAHLLFGIDDLVGGSGGDGVAGMRLRIIEDGPAGAVLYTSQADGKGAAGYTSVRSFEAGGKRWNLRFESTPGLEAQLGGRMAGTIAVFGALGSFLLFGLVRVLSGTRRRAEEIAERTTRALSDQMKLTEDLIELNPIPMFRKGIDGRFLQFNRAWERLTGHSRQAWIGKTTADLFGAAEAERDVGHERDLAAHPDHVERVETSISGADGALCDVIISKAAVRRADGSMAGIIGTITDLTETRRLTAQNEAQREQLALVNQSAQAGVWDIEWPQGTVYFSPRYYEMLGYAQVAGGGLSGARSELVHPDDRALVEAAREAHFNGALPYFDCEYRLKKADGSYLWVNGRGLASLDGAGNPVRFTGSIIDITQRRMVQVEIERQREQLELVIESVQAGVWDENLLDGSVYHSARYREILGFARDADLSADGRDAARFHPQDADAFIDARKRAIADGAPLDLEFRLRRADGGHVWVNARAKASYDAAGVAVRFTGAIIDISKRKEAEFALRDANLRVLEAAQVKSTFLATMSHEIRTPMNGVIGSAGLLQDTRLDSEQQEYVETIRLSGVQLLTLIDDILDFSKIDSGHMELEDEPFEVAIVIEDAFDLVAERARGKRIELLYEVAPEVPRRVYGDITRVRQVLINLVGNAVKFTERGDIFVHCTVASGDAAGSGACMLRFSVRDTGIGIPADKIGRLFSAFTQVDASTTRKYGGTGLGLAISQRLVDLMGGKITVTSEAGSGSCFSFTLATRRAADEPGLNRRMGEIGNIAGKRILIVDDYASNRRILAVQCAGWGLFTVETASVSEALEAIESAHDADTPFDTVISDMLMPEQDGLDLAAAVAAYRKRCGVRLPVLILSSAQRVEAFAGRAVPDGWIDAYLLKPARQAQLFNALLDALAPERPFNLSGPESVARPGGMQPHHGRLHILLAEDNEINQKIALRMLERLGKTATLVNNGLSAVEAVKAGGLDCVLMDVQMPELDGLSATRRIIAETPLGVLPYIVAMTANAMAGDREVCLAAGMHDYIAKPVQMQSLADALGRAQQYLARRDAAVDVPVRMSPVAAGDRAQAHAGGKLAPVPAPPDSAAGAALDMQQVDELLGLDDTGEVLADFIQMYTTQAPQRIAELGRALQQRDLKRVAQVAHSLKGASGNLGAIAVAAVAQRIEAAGHAGDPAGIDQLLREIGARYTEVEAALKGLPQAAP